MYRLTMCQQWDKAAHDVTRECGLRRFPGYCCWNTPIWGHASLCVSLTCSHSPTQSHQQLSWVPRKNIYGAPPSGQCHYHHVWRPVAAAALLASGAQPESHLASGSMRHAGAAETAPQPPAFPPPPLPPWGKEMPGLPTHLPGQVQTVGVLGTTQGKERRVD